MHSSSRASTHSAEVVGSKGHILQGRELALVKLSTDISSRANMQLDLWRKLSVIVTSVSQPKRYMQ
jgi:hypothetical protein